MIGLLYLRVGRRYKTTTEMSEPEPLCHNVSCLTFFLGQRFPLVLLNAVFVLSFTVIHDALMNSGAGRIMLVLSDAGPCTTKRI